MLGVDILFRKRCAGGGTLSNAVTYFSKWGIDPGIKFRVRCTGCMILGPDGKGNTPTNLRACSLQDLEQ
jgi:hypothetical protein